MTPTGETYVKVGKDAYVAVAQALADEGLRATVLAVLRERQAELRREAAEIDAAVALLTTPGALHRPRVEAERGEPLTYWRHFRTRFATSLKEPGGRRLPRERGRAMAGPSNVDAYISTPNEQRQHNDARQENDSWMMHSQAAGHVHPGRRGPLRP